MGKDNVHRILKGTIAEMITKIDPTIYRKVYGTTTRKANVVCPTKEALYKTLQVALLFWKHL